MRFFSSLFSLPLTGAQSFIQAGLGPVGTCTGTTLQEPRTGRRTDRQVVSQHKSISGVIWPGLIYTVCKVTFRVAGDARSTNSSARRSRSAPPAALCHPARRSPAEQFFLGAVLPNTQVLIKITVKR